LLSFAQFEQEVTGERIHDKIAASKKKSFGLAVSLPSVMKSGTEWLDPYAAGRRSPTYHWRQCADGAADDNVLTLRRLSQIV
jgi:hypothetical protein